MEEQKSNLLIDVRSPSEYRKGHIPGSVNLPLFSDEERAQIGTLYKQESPSAAVQKGLEIALPKTKKMIEQANELLKENHCTVYCWRGGLRSQSMTWLLQSAMLGAKQLKGGYKGYRKQNEAFFSRPMKIQILCGLTGSGKTEMLHTLRRQGEQVLDLEGLANHRGGSFGHIGLEQQPSTEHFHNLIGEQLKSIDPEKTLWVEDEGRVLGKCRLPEALYQRMQKAPITIIECGTEERLQRLKNVYGDAKPEEWVAAIHCLRKKLGHQRANLAIEHIHSNRLREAVDIVLQYYDQCYLRAVNQRCRL